VESSPVAEIDPLLDVPVPEDAPADVSTGTTIDAPPAPLDSAP